MLSQGLRHTDPNGGILCGIGQTVKMPRRAMPTKARSSGNKAFTHRTAENSKPEAAPCKLSTGPGFYAGASIRWPCQGGKLRQYGCRLDGKRKTAGLEDSLTGLCKETAEKQASCRKLVAHGLDPVSEKKRVKAQAALEAAERPPRGLQCPEA